MRKLILQTGLLVCLVVALFPHLTGCSKTEHSITEARFTTLEIKTFSTDTLQLKVMTDDVMLFDSLLAPDGIRSLPVQYVAPKHRFRLYDAFTGRLWLDTVVTYKPGLTNRITFLQPSAGANFLWIGAPVNEPLPARGKAKISICYTHAVLPDMLKVIVENNVNISTTDYAPTDSFELKKNEFSRYFLGYTTTSRRVRLKFLNTSGSRKTLAYAEGGFSEAKEADYNIYLFRKQEFSSGDSIRITGEKLY